MRIFRTMKIQKSIDEFILCCEVDRQLSANTVKAYRQDLRQFSTYLDSIGCLEIENVSRNHLREFFRCFRGNKARTIKRKHACIQSFFRFLSEERMLSSNPARELNFNLKMPQMLPKSLPASDMRRIFKKIHGDIALEAESTRLRRLELELCVLELLYGTGVRVSSYFVLKCSKRSKKTS